MTGHFKREVVITEKDDNNFESSIKCWVRDHFNITGKYRSSTHRDCNIKIKLN